MSILDRIRAKITRAKQHIQDFQLALRPFYDTKPYAISFKEDVQAGKRIYYVTKADSVPDSLTAIAADVIQNLRSSLDQIAYQLVLDARSGTEPDWLVYYPISGSASDYPATRSGKIKGVRQEVIDAIDATEPYKGGKGHSLWQLNELNKADKHQILIGAGGFHSGIDISPTVKDVFKSVLRNPADIDDVMASLNQFGPVFIGEFGGMLTPLNIGDELYIEPLDHKVQEDRQFTFDVALNAPGVIECEAAIKTVYDMANLVDGVITSLGRFLP